MYRPDTDSGLTSIKTSGLAPNIPGVLINNNRIPQRPLRLGLKGFQAFVATLQKGVRRGNHLNLHVYVGLPHRRPFRVTVEWATCYRKSPRKSDVGEPDDLFVKEYIG